MTPITYAHIRHQASMLLIFTQVSSVGVMTLTHWGRVTHICVSKLTIIVSGDGLSPGRHQAIIWTNAGILSIAPLRTNFSEILIEIDIFSFKKIHLKMSSGNWRPFCPGLICPTAFAQILILHAIYSVSLLYCWRMYQNPLPDLSITVSSKEREDWL